MVAIEQNDQTGRLRVEGRWSVQDGLLSNLNDGLVGDGGLLVELVDGTALLCGLGEGLGG